MIFKKIDLKGYKLFNNIGIKRFTAEFIAPIVIIIGRNGCGKSSLLKAISAYSQNKADYEKDGRVSIEVEHDRETIELGVDYGEKHPYYIRKDNINLNDSGNTGTHNDIVDSVFGHTSSLEKLLRFEYRMSRMTKKERKEFLMDFNPYDLGMVLEFQKKVSSSLRSIRSNIKMLSQRKLVLEDKAIPVDELEKLKAKVAHLKKEYIDLDKDLSVLQVQLTEFYDQRKDLLNKDRSLTNLTLQKFKGRMEQLSYELRMMWKENEHLYLNQDIKHMVHGQHIPEYIQQLQESMLHLEINIKDKLDKLAQYKSYQALDLDKEVTPRKDRLKVIEDLMVGLPNHEVIPSLASIQLIELSQVILPTLIDNCALLVKCQCKFFHPTQIQKISNKYQWLQTKIKGLTLTLGNYGSSLSNSEAAVFRLKGSTYPGACILNQCILRKDVDIRIEEQEDLVRQYTDLILTMERRLTRYNKALDKFGKILQDYESYKELIGYFGEIHSPYPWLIKLLVEDNKLIPLLNNNITKFIFKVKTLKKQVEEKNTLLQLEEERRTLLYELSKLEDPNIPVKNLIDGIVKNLEKDLHDSQLEHKHLQTNITNLGSLMNADRVYNAKRDLMIKTYEKYQLWYQYEVNRHQIELYEFIRDTIKDKRASINDQLIDSESLLKGQDNIRVILDTEILPVLQDLLKKEVEYDLIEKSMSPSGLPKNYLLSYINNIIENTNRSLAQVWSYELQLVKLTQEDEIDFSFKRIVDGHIASDISMCSESQKDIIDIAWCISMIVALGYGKDCAIFLDECDKHFDEGHREKLITFLSNLIRSGNLRQIFIVNHHAALSSGLVGNQTICLSANNISVPEVYNESVTLHYK